MKTVRLSDYVGDIEDAILRQKNKLLVDTPDGKLEFILGYSEEQVTEYTGVTFLGDRESYLRPASAGVENVHLLTPDGTVSKPEIIRDYQFDTKKIFS